MLTATYCFVAISAEQKIARNILARLKQYVRSTLSGLQQVDFGILESTLDRLSQFDTYCRARKVERYVIPAMRGSSAEVDDLIDELASLSAAAMRTLTSLYDALQRALEQRELDIRQLLGSMEQYCDKLASRFAREEELLFPLTQRWFSTDAWFAIGAQFLSDDGNKYAHHRVPPPSVPQVAALV